MTAKIIGSRLADTPKNTTCCANGGVFNNNNKKVARHLRTNLNAFTEWKAKERRKNHVFSALWGKYMLPGLVTCSRRVHVTFFLCPEERGCSRQGT